MVTFLVIVGLTTSILCIITGLLALFSLYNQTLFNKNLRFLIHILSICSMFTGLFSFVREFLHMVNPESPLINIINEGALIFMLIASMTCICSCIERVIAYVMRRTYEKDDEKFLSPLSLFFLFIIILEPVISKILIIKGMLASLFNMILHTSCQLFASFLFVIVVIKNYKDYQRKMSEKGISRSLSEKYQITISYNSQKTISIIIALSTIFNTITNVHLIVFSGGELSFLSTYELSLVWMICYNVGIISKNIVITLSNKTYKFFIYGFLNIKTQVHPVDSFKQSIIEKNKDEGTIYFKGYKW